MRACQSISIPHLSELTIDFDNVILKSKCDSRDDEAFTVFKCIDLNLLLT
jgi:hypothetical protein